MIIAPLPIQHFTDNNGQPAAGYQLFSYIAGSTTKQATFSDAAGTANTNPIILNQRGECLLYIDSTKTYKFVLTYPTDSDPPTTNVWSIDNVPGSFTGAIQSTQIVYIQTPAEQAASVTPTNYSSVPGGFTRYGAHPTASAATNTTAINNALLCNAIVFDDLEGYSTGGNIYQFNAPLVKQMQGQRFKGRGNGDTATNARTVLKYTGAAGGDMIRYWSGSAGATVNHSECLTEDMLLDGNNLAGNGINAYGTGVSTGAWRSLARNVSVINVNNNNTAITFTGAPTGVTTTLTAVWGGATGVFPVTFSDGQIRGCEFVNASAVVNWSVALTGTPTASATVKLAAAFFWGWGTGNANQNDSGIENCFVNGCNLGFVSGGTTESVKKSTFTLCGVAISGTNGAVIDSDGCTFYANAVDVGLYNVHSYADKGSEFQNSTQAVLETWLSATVFMGGSHVHTACASQLMNLHSAAGHMAFPGVTVETGSASTLVTGFNPTYNYDVSTFNCTTPASFGYQRRIIGFELVDQGDFLCSITSTTAAITGDGTVVALNAYPVTVTRDYQTCIAASTGIFTARVTGPHIFNPHIELASLAAGHVDGGLDIVVTGTSAQTYQVIRTNPYAQSYSGQCHLTGTCEVMMTAGDTAYMQIRVSGGAKAVTVLSGGSGLNYRTSFQGRLA